jgi:hypothetical protein
MKITTVLTNFAAYDCDSYGAGSYNEDQNCGSEGLANTGYDVLVPLALGVAIVIASVILLGKRLWRKHRG